VREEPDGDRTGQERSGAEAGLLLRATINEMCTWTHRYLDHIIEARHRFDTLQR